MQAASIILKSFLLLVLAVPFSPHAEALPAPNCKLPPDLYQQRKKAGPLTTEQREIDRTYVRFMTAVAQSYAKNDDNSVKGCCEPVKGDLVGSQFCALILYLQSNRTKPDEFLAALPVNPEQRESLWLMEMISAGGTYETASSLPGIPLPNGLLFKFVDEIFALMKKGNTTAAERYLFLYDDADGEFGEYMDDQLPKLFLNYPQRILAFWPIFKKHRARLESMRGFTEDATAKRIVARYSVLCRAGDDRCAEITSLFVAN